MQETIAYRQFYDRNLYLIQGRNYQMLGVRNKTKSPNLNWLVLKKSEDCDYQYRPNKTLTRIWRKEETTPKSQ